MLYAFFWIIPRRLKFICQRFGTLCLFHLHRQVRLPACEDETGCSETSAYKLQTPKNYPKESKKHSASLSSGFIDRPIASIFESLIKFSWNYAAVLRMSYLSVHIHKTISLSQAAHKELHFRTDLQSWMLFSCLM
jgi:predicted DNA-binding transcriptional regulator AlpA